MPLYVADEKERATLLSEAENLPALEVSSAVAANAVMLGGGYFTPLAGFMDRQDALHVAHEMHTANGLFWPVPVLNLTDSSAVKPGGRISLCDPGSPGTTVLAIQDVERVEALSDEDIETRPTQASRRSRRLVEHWSPGRSGYSITVTLNWISPKLSGPQSRSDTR